MRNAHHSLVRVRSIRRASGDKDLSATEFKALAACDIAACDIKEEHECYLSMISQ